MFFFANIAFDIACGPEIDPYDYYISFFHNDAGADAAYRPFYFTNYRFLYADQETTNEADINAAEWAGYLGAPVKAADVGKAMYRLGGIADSVLLAGYLKGDGALPDSLKNNTFLTEIVNHKDAVKYYRFAKSVEKITNTATDPWNPKPPDSVNFQRKGLLALLSAIDESDKFLQLRYFYQAQRLLHYAKSYVKASNIYDEYILKYPSASHVKGWAMALKAGELRKMGDTLTAAYLFAKVFKTLPERRVQAFKNYRYISPKTAQVLALANTDDERTAIYAIEGFGAGELNLEPLQKVYQLSPASGMVGVLLVREINKLEERFLTGKLGKAGAINRADFYHNPTDSQTVTNHLTQLKNFCIRLSTENKYPQPETARLALAYIAWMQGNTDEGIRWLKALYDVKLPPKLDDQKQIIQLLLLAQQTQKYNYVDEDSLLPGLKWLESKVITEKGEDNPGDWEYYGMHPFAQTARNFYRQILAPAYLKQGDTTKAALAVLNADALVYGGRNDFTEAAGFASVNFWQNYLHAGNLERLISWKQKAPADDFLNFFALKLKVIDNSTLNEMLGTVYLREHDYAKAVNCLKQVPAGLLNKYSSKAYTDQQIMADPFIERVNDYPKVYTYSHARGYNKLQFAIAMNNLARQLETDPLNAASYYYKMATGIYNTSQYGNAWYLISYSWSSADYGRGKKYDYDDDYIKAANAEKLFIKAQSLAVTREFKAKCAFMAAKCHQKQLLLPEYGLGDYDKLQQAYIYSLRNNTYFSGLKNNYRHTVFFKKAVGECTYLKDFVGGK